MSGATGFYICEAFYHGFREVEGSQSALSIAELVEGVVNPPPEGETGPYRKSGGGARVQLQLDEERLRVVPVRKDEGFESDSEGSSGSLCEDACCNSAEVKVIRDHVLRLDKLLRQDPTSGGPSNCTNRNRGVPGASNNTISSGVSTSNTTSSGISTCNNNNNTSTDASSLQSEESACVSPKKMSEDGTLSSSGAESEDDGSPRLHRSNHHSLGPPSPGGSESFTPSTGGYPSLLPYAPDTASLPISPSADGIMAAASDTFLMSDILFCHICGPRPKVVVVVAKVAAGPCSQLRGHVLECLSQQAAKTLYTHYHRVSNQYKLNRYRNSKRKSDAKRDSVSDGYVINNNSSNSSNKCKSNGIGKESVLSSYDSNIDVFNSLRSCAVRKDSGTSSISETSSVRGSIRSLRPDSELNQDKNINVIEVKASEHRDDSQPFSLVQHTDSNGITHIEIESGPVSLLNGGSVSSDFSSIISLSTPETNGLVTALGGIKSITNAKHSNNGNSCPNSLITSERETITVSEKDKKFRQRQPALLIRDEEESFHQKSPRISTDDHREARSRRERYVGEKNSRSRDTGRPPLPPPSTWAIPERASRPREISRTRDHTRDYNSKNKHNKGPAPPPPPRRHPHDSNLLLVPTKSGHEPKRSYYPKESHIVRGNKVVRVDFPTVPVWGHRAEINNNARHYVHYTGGWAHEYHAPRIREPSLNSELRRRSRSKSPARKPLSNRYLDAVTTFNFSQKLKEISEAVFSSKRTPISNSIVSSLPPIGSKNRLDRTGHHRTGSTASSPGDGEPLRPAIKRGKQKCDQECLRRVTFSAYATVQLMES